MALAFVSLMFGTLLRSTILAVLCGLLLWIFRVKAAEMRHLLWRIVLLALFVLSALQFTASSLPYAGILNGARQRAAIPLPSPQSGENAVLQAMIGLYLFVTYCFLTRLTIGLFRLKRIADQTEFVADLRLHRLAHGAWLENGAQLKPRVRVSNQISVPVAVDLDDALIFLPRSWPEWNEEKLRAVLMHEMAHIARRDSSSALLASLAVCIFWFHPLSWFLRRQLADLAEEACDDAALRTISAPQQYARILIDFASQQSGRALVSASAAVRGPQIKGRLEHLYASSQSRNTPRAVRTLLLAVLFTAINVTAAAPFHGIQPQNETGLNIVYGPITLEQASEFVSRLQKDPDDLNAREKLLDYYAQEEAGAKFVQQLVWVIEHHPDSNLTFMSWVVLGLQDQISTPENIAAVKSAWRKAAQQNPPSPGALWGVGISIEKSDPERALRLFQRAQQLSKNRSSDKYRHAIATVYIAALITDVHLGDTKFGLNNIAMSLNTATALRGELESSKDPALLSYVGTALVSLSESPGQDAQSKLGLDYLQRAVDLDPGNPRWTSALEAAKVEPARRRAYTALLKTQHVAGGTVRVGAAGRAQKPIPVSTDAMAPSNCHSE